MPGRATGGHQHLTRPAMNMTAHPEMELPPDKSGAMRVKTRAHPIRSPLSGPYPVHA